MRTWHLIIWIWLDCPWEINNFVKYRKTSSVVNYWNERLISTVHEQNQTERREGWFRNYFLEPGTYAVILVCRIILAPAKAPIAAGSIVRHWSVAHRVESVSYTGRTLPRQAWGRPSWPTTSRDALTSETVSTFQDGRDWNTELSRHGETARIQAWKFSTASSKLFF